ncbi:Histone RNA hairpin-binding protein [Diplonema papillatum]|nr:Histone RNA hairpin-binding protein [Diplonema papillatum]
MVETGKRSPKEAARFRQRVKQVVIGKMTHGYRNYTKLTPKGSREEEHMDTPHVSPRSIAEVSKREFETAVRTWRKFLHHDA